MQHTLPTINFNPNIKLKVNVSLRGGASDTPVGGRCWPAFSEQLMHSSKACGFLARGAPAQAQVGGQLSARHLPQQGLQGIPKLCPHCRILSKHSGKRLYLICSNTVTHLALARHIS